jgi:hypothetical protein
MRLLTDGWASGYDGPNAMTKLWAAVSVCLPSSTLHQDAMWLNGIMHCCCVLLVTSGYSLPLEGFLYRRPKGKLRLITDLSTSFEDVWVEQLETRVVLPEGAQGIKASVRWSWGSSVMGWRGGVGWGGPLDCQPAHSV